MEKYLINCLLIFILACGDKPKDSDKSVIDVQGTEHLENNRQEDISSKSQISEVDLRIARELTEDITSLNPDLFIEHYDAYFNDKALYVGIIQNQFASVSSDSIQFILDQFLNNVIDRTRNIVLEDYNEFNSLEGRFFSFLYMVKDSTVNQLLMDIQNNPHADSVETEKLKRLYPLIESGKN